MKKLIISIVLILISCSSIPTGSIIVYKWRCRDCRTYEWVQCTGLEYDTTKEIAIEDEINRTIYIYDPENIDTEKCFNSSFFIEK